MHLSDDMQLLQEYAKGHSEEAFAALVSRHINLVYSAAMRSVNNAHEAEEITQAVFLTLAQKSRALRSGTVLSGWLYQTTRLTASNFVRKEMRRQHREQEAHLQSIMNEPEAEPWTGVGPLLDEAMAQLNEKDRNAIVLRFFEGKPMKEVGHALSASEEAAQMRVSRALEKLRDVLKSRGITMPAAALAAAISENSIQAAPAGLAASVAANVLQAGVATLSTLTLVKGTIQLMTATKISIAIGVGAAAVIALQCHQISTTKQAMKQLQEQVALNARNSQALQAENAKLQERNIVYAKSMESMAHDVAKARARNSAALHSKPAVAGIKGNALAEMFKDPAIVDAMKEQQASMLKMQYAPLVKQLNLSPEDADKFYQILSDRAAKGMEALQSGKIGAASADTSVADLKSLLGDSGYTQYTTFTQNMADQTMLTMMTQNFADNPLSDTQKQQLLQAMNTARQNVTPNSVTPDFSSPDEIATQMDQFAQQQKQVDQNVLQQAAAFLTPDQLQTLSSSQSNIISMQKVGWTMAQKMFTKPASSQ
jgi:RNA polymerase sigma factor (sigma-70 family)